MGEPATLLPQFVEDVETFGAGGEATVFDAGMTEQYVLRNVLPAYDRDGRSHVVEAAVVYQDAEFVATTPIRSSRFEGRERSSETCGGFSGLMSSETTE